MAAQSAPAVDPPGFAPITVKGAQIVRLNVSCFDHQVGNVPPNPCTGDVMFHDASGRELKRATYELRAGQSTSLQLAIPATTAAGQPIDRVTIIPCIFPAPGGLAIPSVEVFDRDAGRVVAFMNPAAARMSDFNNDPNDVHGGSGGFDPQPDPPGFGLMTLRADQSARLNLFCFEHPVNGLPPSPCQGTIVVHDVDGNVLRRTTYQLAAGQSRSFLFVPPSTRTGGSLAGIIPCFLPDPGGRAVPSIEVMDSAGAIVVQTGPAVARMSQFQAQPLNR